MGRTTPSNTLPPPSTRKAARTKLARSTITKTIPALLSSNPRARKGIQSAELIVDPPQNNRTAATDAKTPEPKPGESDPRPRRRKSNSKSTLQKRSDLVIHVGAKTGLTGADKSNEEATKERNPIRIRLLAIETLTAASLFAHDNPPQQHGRIGILSMASPLRPGGGFLRGASAQEEFLCMRTTLLPALKEDWYRLPEVGGIYVPDVLVFRGAPSLDDEVGRGKANKAKGDEDVSVGGVREFRELRREERFYVDVVGAGMLRFPELKERIRNHGTGEMVYADAKDLDMTKRKMKGVMRMFEAKRVERVVLGAWGCGAYGNPLGEVARAWKKVLLGTEKKGKNLDGDNWSRIKEIVFAIRDRRMAEDFATYWDDGLVVEEGFGRKESKDDDEGSRDTEELEARIEEIGGQVELARTPMLKAGLETVLEGLKSQREQVSAATEEAISEEDDEEIFHDDSAEYLDLRTSQR